MATTQIILSLIELFLMIIPGFLLYELDDLYAAV